LVLRYAHDYPDLTANIGNIALLKRCGELQLIDPTLAAETANTYRILRKYQHNIRLQGEEKARVPTDKVAQVILASQALWNTLLT